MALFTVQEILEITGARVVTGQDPRQLRGAIRRICTDSREARPGDLFVALLGERFDGHEFVEAAFGRGAMGAIVQDRSRFTNMRTSATGQPGRGRSMGAQRAFVLEVPNSLLAYQQLAAHHRRRFHHPVVAVTGSNGKTTTKEMVARVLEQRWNVLKTEGNLNNRIGVPHTLFRLTPRHQAAVVEMGVDQRGQTAQLCEIARPTIGLITNIGPDHLEFFGSLEGSAQAKAELVDFMPADGALVLNADDRYFDEFAARARCQVLSFGLTNRAQVRAVGVAQDSRRGVTFGLVLPDRKRHSLVTMRTYGTHNVCNALAAASVGHLLGLSGSAIADGLASFRPTSMRSQVVVRDGIRIINDCYNANPASMRAAIDVLAELGATARTVAVLGDMLELGSDAFHLHREVGEYLAGRRVSYLIATGDLGKSIAEGARAGGMAHGQILEATDSSRAAVATKELVHRGDVVLVKGSRGMRMERVMEALTETPNGSITGRRTRSCE